MDQRDPWLDIFLGRSPQQNGGISLLNGRGPQTGLNLPSITNIASGLDPMIQALVARFPDLFDTILNSSPDEGAAASSGPDGASAVSGGRSARMDRGDGGRQPSRDMNGYPNMREPSGALGALMNTQPRGGGFAGMVDRLGLVRQAQRDAKRADRGMRHGGTATSNANGGTVRMGDVNDPNAKITIDVSGGREVQRAQRARRRGY